MGNRYEQKICSSCKEETTHRVFKRYGKTGQDGRKGLRRIVSWCLECQKRTIDNRRHRKSPYAI